MQTEKIVAAIEELIDNACRRRAVVEGEAAVVGSLAVAGQIPSEKAAAEVLRIIGAFANRQNG